MEKHMALGELQAKINRFPRVRFAVLPTPLHSLPRLSEAIGGPQIFIKRDDLTGLAFGGNKTRMFEFLLAKAKEEGADTIVGGAGVQSNYCRQLTAACNALGLEVHLVLRRIRGRKDDAIQGNLLLDLIAGAKVHIIDADPKKQRQAIFELAEKLRKKGKKPFVVRMAAEDSLIPDVVSYVNCFCEVLEQCRSLGINPSRLYVSSYDSTQAGLELGRAALKSSMQIIGVAPGIWETKAVLLVEKYANQVAEVLGLPVRVRADEVYNTVEYVGKGYGIPTRESVEAIKLLARTEGIFLDPVYTSKTMAALIDHVRRGELRRDDTVLFLHTGGTPALFAYVEELDPDELKKNLSFD
jgi:D-cysteine desulfhydrase family pyridoxal phosphate-dependent enzyme